MFGTLGGGLMLDRLGSSLRAATLLCAGGTLFGGTLLVLAFATAQSFGTFLFFFAVGELGLFCQQVGRDCLGAGGL